MKKYTQCVYSGHIIKRLFTPDVLFDGNEIMGSLTGENE